MALAARRFPLVLAMVVLGTSGLVPRLGGRATSAGVGETVPPEPTSYIVSFAPGASGLGRLEALSTASAIDGSSSLVVFDSGAGFAAPLDPATVAALRAMPAIAAVTPNRTLVVASTTAAHLERIGAPAAWQRGLRGDGQTIAVIDTGVDTTNPNLTGVVRAEACFTPPRPTGGGDCPDGSNAQTGTGAAVPCTGRSDCSHGTHVASIAAGVGPEVFGVAPAAQLLAVQTFTSVRGIDDRVVTDEASLVRALEWIERANATRPVAAINMSLGGAPSATPCTASPALRAVLDRLVGAGVAIVASAGNDASSSMLSFPACLPGVVAVAAEGTAGQPASFTNTAPQALLYAPGEAIEGAWTEPCCTRVVSGTSFAAPQVAAAFALLRQQNGPGDVASRIELLRRTGDSVRDALAGSYAGASAVRLAAAVDPQYQGRSAAPARAASPLGALDVVTTEPGAVRLAGWAVDPDNVGPVTVHVYVDGALVRALDATRARPDVGAVFGGYGTEHGYDVRIAVAPGAHDVSAYAIDLGPGAGNVLLGCRTVAFGGPVGALDAAVVAAGSLTVSGWAFDTAQAGPVDAEVTVDGVVVGRGVAADLRPDVGAVYPAYGAAHGFVFVMPVTAGAHEVCVRASALDVAAAGRPVACRSVVAGTGDPVGVVDVAQSGGGSVVVAGWAIDPDATAPIRVRIVLDGRADTAMVVLADDPRPDLATGAPGYGIAHGFRATLVVPPARRVCVSGLDPALGSWSVLGCVDVTAG